MNSSRRWTAREVWNLRLLLLVAWFAGCFSAAIGLLFLAAMDLPGVVWGSVFGIQAVVNAVIAVDARADLDRGGPG